MVISEQAAQKYFSFAEIVQGRDASVRVTVDGLLYAVDLVMVVTGKNREDAAKAIRDLPTQLFQPELFSCRQPEKGGHPTKLLTFQNAMELVMVLPGRVAKDTRTQFANIIRRYMAGDLSLLSEIQANAASASPVAQMARESLGIVTDDDLARKRRREDLELDKLQQDIQEQRRQSMVTHVHSYMDTMQMLDSNWKKDQRLVVQLKDLLTNVTLDRKALGSSDDEAIYITMVAREMGYPKLCHGQDCMIGKELAKLYREKYGKEPPTCKRLVNGTEMAVKHYIARDRSLMAEAISNVMKK